MMRRTPMKRTAFARKAKHAYSGLKPEYSAGTVDRSSPAIKKAPARAVMGVVSSPAAAIPKESVVRSEPYRRLVAALPCINCRIAGFSQAAHVPPDGKGIKQDDRQIFPLCCARIGIPGCHADYDQYRLFPHEKAVEVGREWAKQTRRRIAADGTWPKNLQPLEAEE